MSMSKKDFIALADELKRIRPECSAQSFETVVHNLACFCYSRNQNFKRERWLDYIDGKCGKNGGKVKQETPCTPAQVERANGGVWLK